MSAAKGPTFEVFTLFPEAITAFASAGLLGKAVERGIVGLHCTNFRDFATDKHRTVDDTPFGGGPGMVLRPEPVVAALEAVERARGPMHRVLLDPSGRTFDQRMARRFSTYRRIALLCGRYEGFDARVRDHHVDECVSLGDFVLNGGEVAALAIIEAVFRLCEGALGNPASVEVESHADAGGGTLLEAPQYTRPATFAGREVPPVLRTGDHGAIAAWRAKKARERTWLSRPELRRVPAWSADTELFVAVPAGSNLVTAGLGEVLRNFEVKGLFGVGQGESDFALAAAQTVGGRPSVSSFRTPAQLRRRMRKQFEGPVGFVWVDPSAPFLRGVTGPVAPAPARDVVGGYLRDVLAAVGAQTPRAVVVAVDPQAETWQGQAGVVAVEPEDPVGLAVAAEIAKAPSPQDPAGWLQHVLAVVRAAWPS